MHDPMTVAHEIYLGSKKKKNGHYRSPFLTIWHVDPEIRGNDDSCGWFIRAHHLDKEIVEEVKKDFDFEFKNNYWFNDAGYPQFSTMGVALCMYSRAAWTYFIWKHKGDPSDRAHKQYKKFMRKYLFDILHFAENPTDSLYDAIHMKYGVQNKNERSHHFATIIIADIARKERPWWKHPRWHIHHWKIQFPPWQNFYRRYFLKCSICGKRGFKSSPMSDWDGTRRWHQECDRSTRKEPAPINE